MLEHLARQHDVVRRMQSTQMEERVEDVARQTSGTDQGRQNRLGTTTVVEPAGAGPETLRDRIQQPPEESSVPGIFGVIAVEPVAPRLLLGRRVIPRMHGEKPAAETLAEAPPERAAPVAQIARAAERTGAAPTRVADVRTLFLRAGRLERGEAVR